MRRADSAYYPHNYDLWMVTFLKNFRNSMKFAMKKNDT